MPASTFPTGLDRPVVGCVTLDPAYTGPAGIAVGRWGAAPADVASWQGDTLTTHASRWLGDAVCERLRPGERFILVAESTAYGGMGVARKLGIPVGAVEGCLIDLNAIEPRTRLDVGVATWRSALGIRVPRALKGTAERRSGLKLQALERARDIEPGLTGDELDRAEALCIWLAAQRWWDGRVCAP